MITNGNQGVFYKGQLRVVWVLVHSLIAHAKSSPILIKNWVTDENAKLLRSNT